MMNGDHVSRFTDDHRLSELRAKHARCVRERLRERRGLQEVGAVCRSLESPTTATDKTTAGRVEAGAPSPCPRISTSCSPRRSGGSTANQSETRDFKQKQGSGRASPEHPKRGMQLGAPPHEDQNKDGPSAGASAGADGSTPPTLPPSPSKLRAADSGKYSREVDSPRTARSDGWRTTGEPGGDDEVLEYFLARHAKDVIPPLVEVAGRRSNCRPNDSDERDLKRAAVESERDARVLW